MLNEGDLSAIKHPIVDRVQDLVWIDFLKPVLAVGPLLCRRAETMEGPGTGAVEDPDIFLSTVRLTSLEALRIRLGDGFYMEAKRHLCEQPARSVPVERQYHIREEALVDQHGIWNGLRYWFTDRPSKRGSNDSWR